MKTELRPGAVIETTTPEELTHHLNRGVADWFQERARGVQRWLFQATDTVTGGGALTIPGTADEPIGPARGFAVMLFALHVSPLNTADTLTVWRTRSDPGRRLAQLTNAVPDVFPGKGIVLLGGETLTITGSGLMTTGDVTVSGEGVIVPEPDIFKMY